MIQRYPTHPEVVASITSRQAEIKRLEAEMQLAFGVWALTAGVPAGARLVEANGNVLVVDEPEPKDEQSD